MRVYLRHQLVLESWCQTVNQKSGQWTLDEHPGPADTHQNGLQLDHLHRIQQRIEGQITVEEGRMDLDDRRPFRMKEAVYSHGRGIVDPCCGGIDS